MPDPRIRIATPRDAEEIEPFRRIVGQALLIPPGHGQAATPSPGHDDWMAREGIESFRLVHLGGRVVAGYSLQRLGQWIGGRSVPTGAVRAVAVAPEVRSKGVTRTMLRHAFHEMREAGIPLSTLYPATHVVYRRIGYELAGSRTVYRLPLAGLRTPSAPASVEVREASLSGPLASGFEATYRARARAGNGPLDRDAWLWRRVLDPVAVESPSYAYQAVSGDAVVGHVIFSQNRLPGSVRGEIVARDLVALTPEALAALLRLLAEHRSIVDSVSWPGAPAEAVLCHLENPTLKVEGRWDWMLRIVDAERAIGARGFSATLAGEVDLEIRDEVLEWNAGRFVLAVGGGGASLVRGGSGRTSIDIRGLAALYTSFLTPSELVAAGYLAGKADDLGTLAAVFAGPAPWMPDFF